MYFCGGSNFTSEIITKYRNDARETIKKSCNVNDNLDNLLFVGTGSTSAVHKLIKVVDNEIKKYKELKKERKDKKSIVNDKV